MTKTIQGIHIPSIRCLRPVLLEWIKSNIKIAEAWHEYKDVPWWYNERAELSIFAGAVWRVGGFSFEEFSESKRSFAKSSVRLSGLYNGRVDMYFQVSDFEFIAEAKQKWSGALRTKGQPITALEETLRKACREMKQTRPHGQRRLGMLFARPYLKKRRGLEVDSCINTWIQKVCQIEHGAMAWVFPSVARNHSSSLREICPGEAIIIREV